MHDRSLEVGVGVDNPPADRIVQAPEIGSRALRGEDRETKEGGGADHNERRLS